MKKLTYILSAFAIFAFGTLAFAASSNGNGQSTTNSNGNSASSSAITNQNQVQVQTNNPGTGTQTQTQTQLEERIQESKSEYSPRNEQAQTRMSEVALAAENLIRVAENVQNQGIGDQIRNIARTQSENQDKINQSVDKAENRSSLAKFFIGTNFSEIKNIQTIMEQNRNQIQELEKIQSQVENQADQLKIANQVIVLQNQQLKLRDQLKNISSGFSLFGWLNRWIHRVSF